MQSNHSNCLTKVSLYPVTSHVDFPLNLAYSVSLQRYHELIFKIGSNFNWPFQVAYFPGVLVVPSAKHPHLVELQQVGNAHLALYEDKTLMRYGKHAHGPFKRDVLSTASSSPYPMEKEG